MVCIGNSWDEILKDEFKSDYYLTLREFLKKEYFSTTVYPPMGDIFNALKLTDYEKVKVVILGQDPYHGKGQAMGLCFSVPKDIAAPPSLVNIFKEMESDIHIKNTSPDLTAWARQGVLLLNTSLTVREGQPNSHKGRGWEILTDKIIEKVSEKTTPVVFILWGSNARSKKSLIKGGQHLIIESAHPSPLSAYNGFFGSKPFSRTNDFLVKAGLEPVDWRTEL